MSRRRIWLIIIGILIAGVSATWAMEKFVSSHGVNTAAVVGFEADAMQQDAGNSGNPYMAENRMKMAENAPAPQNAPAPAGGSADNGIALYQAESKNEYGSEDAGETSENGELMKEAAKAPDTEVSILSVEDHDQAAEDGEKEAAEEELSVSAAGDTAAAADAETVKSPLESDSAAAGNAEEAKLSIEYTRADLEERLETARAEAEKYQDDQAMSQPSRYAAAEYVRNLWDRELNLIYSSIHKEMDETAAEALRREEVEWIKKRDLAADKASTKSTGTPTQSIEYVRTSASVTMDRCYELLENYGDYLDPEEN